VDLFFIGDFEAKIWMRLTSYALRKRRSNRGAAPSGEASRAVLIDVIGEIYPHPRQKPQGIFSPKSKAPLRTAQYRCDPLKGSETRRA